MFMMAISVNQAISKPRDTTDTDTSTNLLNTVCNYRVYCRGRPACCDVRLIRQSTFRTRDRESWRLALRGVAE